MKRRSLKALISMIIVFQMILSMGVLAFGAVDEDGNIVDPGSAIPAIVLINGPVFDVKTGEVNHIEVKIKNSSSFVAKSLVIQPEFGDVNNSPFSVAFEESTNKFSSISPRSETIIKLAVNVDKTAASKNYALTLNYTFFNEFSNKHTGKDTIYFKVKNTSAEPQFVIEDIKMTPGNINPGESAELSGYISNEGHVDMHDVDITLDGLLPEAITLSNGLNGKRIAKIPARTGATFAFNIGAAKDMKGGNYPITFKLKYTDDSGKAYERTQQYYINVGGASGKKPTLEIKNMVEPTGVYGVNSNFNIDFDVFNLGETEAKNVKVSAIGIGEGGVVPKSSSIKNIKLLKPNESQHFSFIFAPTSASKSQNYSVEFTVEYDDGGTAPVIFKQYAGVNVTNPEKDNEEDKDENVSKPKIIISNYECDPIIVMAGKEFDLNMTLMNTHKDKDVKNIKMFLTLSEEKSTEDIKTGNIFTPVDSSNTFYFDSIPSKTTVDKNLRLYVVPDAQPKTYTLTVNFEYEDMDGKEYTAAELLGINVKQVTELDMDEFMLPEQVEMGMPVNVSFGYFNTGKVTLNNVMIKIEGDVESKNKSTYIGNMESGNSDYFDGEFIPTAIGKTPVSIIVTYTDPAGETIEKKRDFIVDVIEPMQVENPEDMGDVKPVAGELTKKQITGLVVVIVIALVGVFIVIKKNKSYSEKDFLEDDEEEIVSSQEGDSDEHI